MKLVSLIRGVQIFFHSPVVFINSVDKMGGNLENSDAELLILSTEDFVNNRRYI